jgi:large subunit ribosomal protein L24
MAKLRKGDTVVVITGKDRNKTGVIEKVFPKEGRVVVTGINMAKKHMKKSSKFPQGGIIDKNMPVHISNVMIVDPVRQKPTRVGIKTTDKGRARFAKLSKEMLKDAVKETK